MLDAVLDVLTSGSTTLVIFAPYAQAFDVAYGDFPLLNNYDDTWFIDAVAENRQVFAISWLDVVSKTVPGYGILSSLRGIKASLLPLTVAPDQSCDVAPKSSRAARASAGMTPRPVQSTGTVSVAPLPPASRQRRSGESGATATALTRLRQWATQLVQPRWRRDGKRLEALLVLWGVAVAAVHVHASTVAWSGASPGCLLEKRPWVALRYNCVVLEVHCALGLASPSRAQDVARAFAGLELAVLKSVIFSSCAALEMPPALQRLSGLETRKVFNSSISVWSDDAVLTAAAHAHVRFIYVVDTNVSHVPDGLLSPDFPLTLRDVEFSGANLSGLPSDLPERWPRIDYLVIESSASLTAVPDVLARMQLRHLSLCSNAIARVPPFLLRANQSLQALDLAGNPLAHLPERDASDSDTTNLYSLTLGRTHVAELPVWMRALSTRSGAQLTIAAGGTPLCRDIPARATDASVEILQLSDAANADCTESDRLPMTLSRRGPRGAGARSVATPDRPTDCLILYNNREIEHGVTTATGALGRCYSSSSHSSVRYCRDLRRLRPAMCLASATSSSVLQLERQRLRVSRNFER